MNPGKSVCALLLFAPLLCGCYSQQELTKEDVALIEERIVFCPKDSSYVRSAPSDEMAYFYLVDGSYVESDADYHRRVNDGFQVWGTVIKKGKAKEKWGGVIHDSAVQAITPEAIDSIGAVFYLNDGSFVEAQPKQQKRMETGYRVSGSRFTKITGGGGDFHWQNDAFSGVIDDSDIRKITTSSKLNSISAVFYLTDGSYIESGAGKHVRLESGYRLSGNLYTKIVDEEGDLDWKESSFSGVIEDSAIQEINALKIDVVPTVASSFLGVGIIVGGILMVSFFIALATLGH